MRFSNWIISVVLLLSAGVVEAKVVVSELYFKSAQGFLVGNLALDSDEAVELKARLMLSDVTDRLHTIVLVVRPQDENKAILEAKTQHRLVKISEVDGKPWGEIDYSYRFNFNAESGVQWQEGMMYEAGLFVDGVRIAKSSFSYFVKRAGHRSSLE